MGFVSRYLFVGLLVQWIFWNKRRSGQLGVLARTIETSTTCQPNCATNREPISWGSSILRGGAQSKAPSDQSDANNGTLEQYVSAVEEKDAQHRSSKHAVDVDSSAKFSEVSSTSNDDDDDANSDNSANNGASADADNDGSSSTGDNSSGKDLPTTADEDNSAVGVKNHHKKSNAVGDPDGEDSDASDDSSDEWEGFENELDELEELDLFVEPSTQLQVEVELVEEDQALDEVVAKSSTTEPKSSGGGGVRFGQRISNRRKSRSKQGWIATEEEEKGDATGTHVNHERVLESWIPHVYFPPSPAAIAYLTKNARLLDASSKTRLDRRTLYSALMLEWMKTKKVSNRQFLHSSISQALQSALSLATQPNWRRLFPRSSAISFSEEDPNLGCTLAMQETVAMALAHSLGCAMVIIDDEILSSIRQQLSDMDIPDSETKPAMLLQSILRFAREGKLKGNSVTSPGSIASCMKRDLLQGLDDPYDERALSSCEDMAAWEAEWYAAENQTLKESTKNKPLPLVLFLRTQSSVSLLKSKSAVETLMETCTSSDGINMLIFGGGINSKTVALPQENLQESSESKVSQSRNMQGSSSAPWFGFSPQNQNASGQNDPEGSRRFNIFLARTVDANGTPGILGAIAPPQAGNLFPHMMAMQARERLQAQEEDSAASEEFERWTQQMQQQLQQNDGDSSHAPPQFFNASLGAPFAKGDGTENPLGGTNQPPPQKVIQQTLELAMSELLEKLSQASDEGEASSDLSPDLHKAFAQVLQNDSLRRGIADNLARAAPALSDPKCQGVMLSVYVPPPPHHLNRGKMPGSSLGGKSQSNVGGWFQKILNHQDEPTSSGTEEQDEGRRKTVRQKRVRTAAAAAAVLAAQNAIDSKEANEKQDNKAERNLAKLEALGRRLPVKTPEDPVRKKSWEGWIVRERGSVIFRQNRAALNDELRNYHLELQQNTGTSGSGSMLRQMLSVRDLSDEMEDVIKCSIELEASKSQLKQEIEDGSQENDNDLEIDQSLSQLLISEEAAGTQTRKRRKTNLKHIHPSTLETALSQICRVSPSPSGGLSVYNTQASHRSKEEVMALAQDKHERALVSQVASPQDIGVTYDMIGGLSEVKELLRQSITYPLKFPHLYSEGIAREAVKGVLLFGPPGTGKTMLAKAVATEGGASFLSVDASSVENKWLGESEKNAKAVFTLARRLAPCVVFIDEVDSLLSSREGTSDDSAHGTLTSVKTTMMSEWDGLNSGTNGSGEAGSDRVVVIGSTNRPFDLDEAVLRRFPRRILVDLPDLETRKEILEVTLAENRLDPSVNLTKIAEQLTGYTGSDIKEVCREAVVQISHEQAKLLDQGTLGMSRDDVSKSSLQRLRPVEMEDFEKALGKLKRSVSENGRELGRVWEWNDEYGEIKKEKKDSLPHLMSMYL